MASKEIKKFSEVLAKIGLMVSDDPSFLNKLEKFIASNNIAEHEAEINYEKINNVELFQLIRKHTDNEVEEILSSFNIKELRFILKKYHFGSPSKLKTTSQVRNYILNQLRQRKTDVFQHA